MGAYLRGLRVEIEQPTESRLLAHSTRTKPCCAVNQRVLQTLMVSLTVIVRDELRHRASGVPFAERNDPVETFFFKGAHETLRVGVGVRRRVRCLHDPDSALRPYESTFSMTLDDYA